MNELAIAILTGTSIVMGGILLSEVAEAYQYVVPDSLVAAITSLAQTLPEYAICITLALQGKFNLGFASIIGANIMLICLGYPLVIFVSYLAGVEEVRRDKAIDLMRENALEGTFLLISGIYFLIIGVKGSISLLDAILMLSIFILYGYLVTRIPPEVELEEPRGLAKRSLEKRWFGFSIGLLSSAMIALNAEPFLYSALKLASKVEWITPFFLLSVLTPILSEMPEKVMVLRSAMKNEDMARLGLLNMMSSKVNNGFLLPSSISLISFLKAHFENRFASSISVESFRWDLMLMAAITIFAASTVINRKFTLIEGFYLLPIYLIILIAQHPRLSQHAVILKPAIVAGIVVASIGEVIYSYSERKVFLFSDLKHVFLLIKKRELEDKN